MKNFFAVDVRSLAFFRMALGLLILIDLSTRMDDFTAHYTDAGVFPIAHAMMTYGHSGVWNSLHFLSGSAPFQAFLFGLAALFAISLILGYHTRISILISWILMVSLQERNTLVLSGGDVLFRMLLFWSFFIPLGATFSVDRWLSKEKESSKEIATAGTAALLLQVCLIYWAGALFKWNGGWMNGDAVYYALSIDQFATPFGVWLRNHTEWLPFLTYLTYFFELLGPVLVFIPWQPLKTAIAFAFMGMHAIFGLSLAIGIFALIAVAAWIPFLPGWFWDKLHVPTELTAPSWVFKLFNRGEPPLWRAPRLESTIVCFLIAYVFCFNLYTVYPSLSGRWVEIGKMLKITQHWPMFATPLREDGWFVVQGRLTDGTLVDAFRPGEPFSWEEPPLGSAHYTNARWRKYMMNLWGKAFSNHRPLFVDYLARSWNETHGPTQQIAEINLFYVVNTTPPPEDGVKNNPCPVHLLRQLTNQATKEKTDGLIKENQKLL